MTAVIRKKTKKKSNWQLQEAKAMFSEVVKASQVNPQIITVFGKETAVILSMNEYKRLSNPNSSLYEFIQNSPLRNLSLELPQRLPEKDREVNL
jgi:prevent-host-death family protein